MCLEDDAPPDKPFNTIQTSYYDSKMSEYNPIVNITGFSNTATPIHLVTFDSETVQLYRDTCVTIGLTWFASEFTPGTHNNSTSAKTKTGAGEATIV